MSHYHTGEEEALSVRDFARLTDLIRTQAGICLGPEKKTMVEVRLKRRLRTLNMTSYRDYCDFIFRHGGGETEIVSLINVITTNKTDFFREPAHFDYLVQHALPELSEKTSDGHPLIVWSAGCSSGEEPYTLAMVLSEYAAAHSGFRFRILATDISTTVLDKAVLGIYSAEAIEPVAIPMRKKYLLRSRDRNSNRVRVAPAIRRAIDFRRINFMDAEYALGERVAVIFCRNVLIYFDRPTQQAILNKIVSNLAPSGYLFVGHSETLHDMDLPVVPVAPALYRKAYVRD